MGKRRAEMSEEEHARVKARNTELQRERRAALTAQHKEQLRVRNAEAKRRQRERERQARGAANTSNPDSLAAPQLDDNVPGPSNPRSPRRSESPLTPPPDTPPPTLVQLDQATGVLGVQVAKSAPTVRWSSGQITVLPYVEGEQGENALQQDQAYTEGLAKCPESLPPTDLVVFLSKDASSMDLLTAAREGLSNNKSVVIRGIVDTHGFEFTEAGMYDEFACLPDRVMKVHDMKLRTADFTNPFVNTTLGEFLRGITDPEVVRVALDFPLAQLPIPYPFEKLDDGLTMGWNQTQGAITVDEKLLPGDVWTIRSWGLAHHAGVLTYIHHDSEGLGTHIIPFSGIKNWIIVSTKRGKVTRDELTTFLMELTDSDRLLSQFTDKIDCETIHLYPGDLIIMPPGQLHAVYTPVASFCRGGHFYNLDTMHLTELSRFVDTTAGKYVTNQAHSGTLETLCRLVLVLPAIPRTRNITPELYKRSLVSLCGMVAYHTRYTAQSEKKQRSETLNRASEIAKAVLNHFSIRSYARYQAFMSDPAVNPFERGEEVVLYDVLEPHRAQPVQI
ncbi:hypothetical protein J3R83DRAFT_7657 [Lanmaoa asiatica]|nr:hypothetical protein J3R83DRAFT_7657 [Lanmaoa asiatica]